MACYIEFITKLLGLMNVCLVNIMITTHAVSSIFEVNWFDEWGWDLISPLRVQIRKQICTLNPIIFPKIILIQRLGVVQNRQKLQERLLLLGWHLIYCNKILPRLLIIYICLILKNSFILFVHRLLLINRFFLLRIE